MLVADGRLGGISATLTSFESLRLRGYTVHAIVLIAQDPNDTLGNSATIQAHLDAIYQPIPGDVHTGNAEMTSSAAFTSPRWSLQRSPRVFTLSPIPNDRNQLLHNWFHQNMATFLDVFHHVHQSEEEELRSYVEMHREGLKKVWWPFTNYYKVRPEDVGFIESAHGDHYRVITYPAAAHAKPPPASPVDAQRQPTASAAPAASPGGVNVTEESKKAVFVSAFDGSASWWTQAVGHGHVDLAAALAEAAGRYGHVLFPRHLHAPAVQLARYLTEKGPGKDWADRVFFSENESSAVEVALKMAFRLAQQRRGAAADHKSMMVLSQRGAFHGDSVRAMNLVTHAVAAGAAPHHTDTQHPWYDGGHAVSIATPCVAFQNGVLQLQVEDLQDDAITALVSEATDGDEDGAAAGARLGGPVDASLVTSPAQFLPPLQAHHAPHSAQGSFHSTAELFDLAQRLQTPLAKQYARYIGDFLRRMPREVAVLAIEPLLIATGGMRFVDPLFQHLLVSLARQPPHGLVVLCDETVTGLYRLGPVAAADWLQQRPDVACYAKMLTGGYVPLAVTLASEEVFAAFYPHIDGDARAASADTAASAAHPPLLMHGHSFSASPVACTAALETLRLLENSPRLESQQTTRVADDAGAGDAEPVESRVMAAAFGDEDLRAVSKLPGVRSAMSLGSVLSIHLHASGGPATSSTGSPALTVIRLLRQERVFARHVGTHSICLMVTPVTADYDQQRLLRVLRRALTKAFYANRATAAADVDEGAALAAGVVEAVGASAADDAVVAPTTFSPAAFHTPL